MTRYRIKPTSDSQPYFIDADGCDFYPGTERLNFYRIQMLTRPAHVEKLPRRWYHWLAPWIRSEVALSEMRFPQKFYFRFVAVGAWADVEVLDRPTGNVVPFPAS